ncbi:unnamed protein product [Scytosiphon promiscuus]
MSLDELKTGCNVASHGGGDSVSPAPAPHGTSQALWAVADVFTLLAAATRAADSIAERTGGMPRQAPARAPESLSEIIASLPADTLGLWRASEPVREVIGTAEDDENEEGRATEERGACTGEPVFGDEAGLPTLLSPSSALVFVNAFLGWAAQHRAKNTASLVAEGWDGGIGVWLGLAHSVGTLMRTLKATRGGDRYTSGQREAAHENAPSAEAIALAIFQLRASVGTPSAALHVVEPAAVPLAASLISDGCSQAAPSTSVRDDGPVAGSDTVGGASGTGSFDSCGTACRPPAGKMIRGFLKKMNHGWKSALPWNLPSAALPRRASPRLDRRSQRRGGGGAGCSNATESLKAEAEDLFFALRGELLHAERLVLSTLLVGAYPSLGGRAWTMQAALASARPWCDGETADGGWLEGRRLTSGTVAAAPSACCDGATDPPHASPAREQPPESGSGPARVAPGATGISAPSSLRDASPATDVGTRRNVGKDAHGRAHCRLTRGATASEDCQDGMWDGLGRLCWLAAAEMRAGLETGLSVKLSQAYLDLIELLGNAALEHRYRTHRSPAASIADLAGEGVAASQHTFAGKDSTPSNCMMGGNPEHEDAGGVLLSMVTCHTISQHKLFKRLVRGAVRFHGIGVSWDLLAPRTAADSFKELQARNTEISSLAGDHDSGRGGNRKGTHLTATAACKGSTNYPISSPPAPLERSSRLLVHCVRWIRLRHKDKRGRTSIPSGRNSDIGLPGEAKDDGEEGSTELYPFDGSQSRYSSRPEEVKFASSRECLAAMRTALAECETVLSSAGGPDVAGRDGGASIDSMLADVLPAVAPGLREFFSPAVILLTPAPTARAGKSNTMEASRGSATGATAANGAASPPARAGHRGGLEKGHGKNATITPGGASPLAKLDVFPDTVKLLLMRVLERVYLVGKGATVTASAILAKPSTTAVATVAGVSSASPLTPTLPPTPASCPSPPVPSKRRRPQREAAANASRPGDQAGGAPIKPPAKGRTATATAGGSRSRRSQSKPQPSTSSCQRKGTPGGGGGVTTDIALNAHSEQGTSRSGVVVAKEAEEEPSNPLLAAVLPAVALASGDCLRLMLEAKMWAEALRSNTRRARDDPCRKRASTMLFKIERCELEITTAAQKARQFLEFFEDSTQKSTREAETTGSSSVARARKRSRTCVGHRGCGDGGNAKGKIDPGTRARCDEKVEGALRLLVSGADTLAAWRRDSVAKAKSVANRSQRGGKKGHARHRHQEREHADDAGGERLTSGRGSGARDRFSGASGKRRRSSVGRVRSRNVVIDGWLEEGGEEGGGRGDAFVDLEDFIEA